MEIYPSSKVSSPNNQSIIRKIVMISAWAAHIHIDVKYVSLAKNAAPFSAKAVQNKQNVTHAFKILFSTARGKCANLRITVWRSIASGVSKKYALSAPLGSIWMPSEFVQNACLAVKFANIWKSASSARSPINWRWVNVFDVVQTACSANSLNAQSATLITF